MVQPGRVSPLADPSLLPTTESSGQPADRGSAAWWNARYESGDTPWDTHIVPPEVERLVAGGLPQRGWALDLGCGRGTSSLFLAHHGFHVVGVDLSLTALLDALRSGGHGAAAYFCAGDVADLCFLALRAAFALDIGCFHSLRPERRGSYVRSLFEHLLPGAAYLLYGIAPAEGDEGGPPGLTAGDVARFAPSFALRWTGHGVDRDRASAWYLFERATFG